MAKREILVLPDQRLRQVADAIPEVDESVRQLAADMLETMYAAPGIGLAAPQVGASMRIVVLDVRAEDEEPGKRLLRLINPEIAERDGEVVWEEGCLSVPEYTAPVKRARRILVKAWTPEQREAVAQQPTGDRLRARGTADADDQRAVLRSVGHAHLPYLAVTLHSRVDR